MSADRNRIIVRASVISVAGNALLSLAKITTGLITGSLAVLGDGIDSAVDIVTSVMTLITANIIGKKPNKEFPFGYGRAEASATGLLAIGIFFAGMQLLIRSATGLWEGSGPESISLWAVYVTLFSIGGKVLLAWQQHRAGKKARSSMLMANAKNMLSDVVISVAVLIGLLLARFTGIARLDALTSLLVSLWILRVAFGLYRESTKELMDGVEDTTVYARIIELAAGVDQVAAPHRVRARKLGASLVVYLDIEVDGCMTVAEAHEVSRKVEESIRCELDNVYDVIIHIEPRGNVEEETFGVCGICAGDPEATHCARPGAAGYREEDGE